ncbi:MAG: flagellar hook protein FlgE [Tissierellia bacterium]|nr:flagellar hook protein FlgE [Tissierellia bacterium]
MMRSMYTGVTGLRTHQGKMDTIGHNIANVNTVAYKKGQVTFKETFNQTVRGASGAQRNSIGGINPQQVGMGVGTGAINTIYTRGAGQRTDNPTDLTIEGEGWFVVSPHATNHDKYYTRAGNFNLDNDGNLVTSEGFYVLGYGTKIDEATGEVIPNDGGPLQKIQINKSETAAPTATENIIPRGNLNSNTEVAEDPDNPNNLNSRTTDTVVRDSLGNAYSVTTQFIKISDAQAGNEWRMRISRVTDIATGDYVEPTNVIDGGNAVQLIFNSDGALTGINGTDNAKTSTVTLDLSGLTFTNDKSGGTNPTKTEPSGTFKTITIFDPIAPERVDGLTQYANESTAKTYSSDGQTSGTISSFSIGADGEVIGSFDNGSRKSLGRIILAKFDNTGGLEKMTDNLYKDTRNSGEPQEGIAGGSGYGKISSGTLEMSNTDLALEFTELITTQRGFQANSRIITTSDEMLQELVNIKR